MKQKIFLGIIVIILIIFGVGIFNEYWINHTYYATMLGSKENWKLFIGVIVSSLIPIYYLYKAKVFSLKKFIIYIVVGLLLFSVIHVMIKDTILGGGFVILLINNIIIFALGAYFITGTLSLGTWISNKIIKFQETRRQEMFLNFGIGLGVMLLLVYVLASFGILYPILTWIFFVGRGFIIYKEKKILINYKNIISENIQDFKANELKNNRWKWIGFVLLIISIMYYFYGFELSFIPYSTAWDANHAYMYEPKILAENFGVLWGNVGNANGAPMLWHAFITFWFSLIQPIKSWFWLSADNIAVSMNFLSGIFVLLFSLGVIKEILNFFEKKLETIKDGSLIKNISFYSGWFWILLWLTSGMGAFLVFVDNKTDLGVMAMTILAILSGIIFINHIKNHKEKGLEISLNNSKYVIISGLFFTIASMSKPTAFLDIALFGLLLVGFWFNWIMATGAGISIMGMMGVLQVGNAFDFISVGLGKELIVIGLVVFVVGVVILGLKKGLNDKKIYIRNIILWILSFGISLLILKGPTLLYKQVINGDFGVGNFAKGLLMGQVDSKSNNKLLAVTEDIQTIEDQKDIDLSIVSGDSIIPIKLNSISLDSCKTQNFTKDDLDKNLRDAVEGNEDVGRYVGYGWKEITKVKGLNLSYNILKLIYPKNNKCYGINIDAKTLCSNKYAIDGFDVKYLKQIFTKLDKDGKAYEILSGALQAFEDKGYKEGSSYNPLEFRDYTVGLRQYYQNHSIKTEPGKINIPYRYIIPFNVVYNRSLQNLSSYYTDIGFVWMIMFIFIILSLIYGFIKNEKNLISLSVVAIIGRGIWWLIGGGIVRYGIGLIMWSTMLFVIFIRKLFEYSKNENERNILWVVIVLLGLRGSVQFLFNFIRISSQGAGGPFLWYRMNVGKVYEINEGLQGQEVLKYGYGWKNVFDLQFPHYNKFIDLVKDRPNNDGVLIAGTYIQYFLKNQHNIKGDGMLGRFWEQTSDNDVCKSYQRLKEDKMKYFVIDPNIGTVVMGEGNESLFNRFFAKRDPIDGTIQDHGALSMITKMVKDGYMKLLYSNNIGAKYAYTLDDASLKQTFGNMTDDQILFLRTKLAVARFFPDSNQLIQFIADTFSQRIINGEAIGDIADIMGKQIDENKLLPIAQSYIEKQETPEQTQAKIKELNQDERNVLGQYLGLYNILQAGNQEQYGQALNSLLGQSLGGGSQLIVFQLAD
ncbi:MAG: hypothetical protein WAZ12_04565 [Candidatus Absconditicoccaceae bacterium]